MFSQLTLAALFRFPRALRVVAAGPRGDCGSGPYYGSAIAHALAKVTPQDARAWFNASGYPTSQN